MDKIIEFVEGLIDRSGAVEPMKLIEVDVICLQSAKGDVNSGKDMSPGAPSI